jgi:hypothetical protein
MAYDREVYENTEYTKNVNIKEDKWTSVPKNKKS